MSELGEELRAAFESDGYEVGEVMQNRKQYRISVLDDDASASDLRAIVESVVDGDEMLGLDVSTDTEGDDSTVSTVVSFQYRG